MPFDKTKIKVGATVTAPRIVLVGVEGIGKTTAGAQCEAPVFLSAESGLVGKGYDDIPNYSPEDWEDVLAFLRHVAEDQHDYKSLIIDTIDWVEPLLFSYLFKRDSKGREKPLTSLEDYGYNKGPGIALAEFRRGLAELDKIHRRGILVMINAHCHIKSFNNPMGDNYDRFELKASKLIAGIIKEWADTVLFARYEVFTNKGKGDLKAKGVGGQTRIVHTQHSAAWDAKNRYGLPATMAFDMAGILEAMKSGNPETPENIMAEINALLPQLDEATQKKIAAFVEDNKTNVLKLTQTLNRVRTLTQGNGE